MQIINLRDWKQKTGNDYVLCVSCRTLIEDNNPITEDLIFVSGNE